MPKSKNFALAIFSALLCLLIGSLQAHTLDEGVWENEVTQDGNVKASLKLPLGLIDGWDLNGDGMLVEAELKDEILEALQKHIWVTGDGVKGKPSLRIIEDREAQTTHTWVGVNWAFPSKPKVHEFHYDFFGESQESPKCISRFTDSEGLATAFIFTKEQPVYSLSPTSRGFEGFFLLGVEELALGFDHLAFVVVLMLAGGNALEFFKMIAAFTIAHSLALALAALGIFTLPASLVEPLIALSIAVVAAENIRRDQAESRWLLAAGFGLFHGMGFAKVLADMNISGENASVPLMGFNLGIEAGQMGLIFLVLPVYYSIGRQKWNRKFRVAGSVVAALFALYWTVTRVFGG